MKREGVWVNAIAVILLISGVMGIVVHLFYMSRFEALLTTPLSTGIFVLEMLFSLLYIVGAFGLLLKDERAREFAVAVLMASIFFRVVTLVVEYMTGKPLMEVVFNLYIVLFIAFALYLMKPSVKELFSQKNRVKTV